MLGPDKLKVISIICEVIRPANPKVPGLVSYTRSATARNGLMRNRRLCCGQVVSIFLMLPSFGGCLFLRFGVTLFIDLGCANAIVALHHARNWRVNESC